MINRVGGPTIILITSVLPHLVATQFLHTPPILTLLFAYYPKHIAIDNANILLYPQLYPLSTRGYYHDIQDTLTKPPRA